jgi:hypothetical protein
MIGSNHSQHQTSSHTLTATAALSVALSFVRRGVVLLAPHAASIRGADNGQAQDRHGQPGADDRAVSHHRDWRQRQIKDLSAEGVLADLRIEMERAFSQSEAIRYSHQETLHGVRL